MAAAAVSGAVAFVVNPLRLIEVFLTDVVVAGWNEHLH